MELRELSQAIRTNIGLVIKGKDDVIEKAVLCILCGGHILMEDVPGTGKTTLVKALAQSLGLSFRRIQFTPDLLPSDLTGVNFFDQKEQQFVFRPGPLFTNILLADEINRATPRTQSSLLECMEERQVTVDGETRKLDTPFLVAATQNPIEIQGTFPLPEAQLDRFFMRLSMGYPDAAGERDMLTLFTEADPLAAVKPCVSAEDVTEAQSRVRTVFVADGVKDYILCLVTATRNHEKISLGVSPRGSIALMRAAQAKAAVLGRGFVLPDDVKAVFLDVLSHRILCRAASHTQAAAARTVLEQILASVPVPAVS